MLITLCHIVLNFYTMIFVWGTTCVFVVHRTFHFCKKSPSSVKFTTILFGKKVGLWWRGRNGIHHGSPPQKKKQHFSHLLAPLLQGNYTHTRGWLSQIPERLKRVPLNCCRSRSTWIKVGWTRTAQSTPCCISFEASEHKNKCDIEERLCCITWNIISLYFFFCQRSSEIFFSAIRHSLQPQCWSNYCHQLAGVAWQRGECFLFILKMTNPLKKTCSKCAEFYVSTTS